MTTNAVGFTQQSNDYSNSNEYSNKSASATNPHPNLDQDIALAFGQSAQTRDSAEVFRPDKAHDGKFSILEAGKNLVKGFCQPVLGFISNMFSSPGQFVKSVAMIGVGVAVASLVGPAALVAAGAAFAGWEAVKGVGNLLTAENGDEAEQACLNLGAAGFYAFTAGLGAKAALASGGGKFGAAAIAAEDLAAMSKYEMVQACLVDSGTTLKAMGKGTYSYVANGNLTAANIRTGVADMAQTVTTSVNNVNWSQIPTQVKEFAGTASQRVKTAYQKTDFTTVRTKANQAYTYGKNQANRAYKYGKHQYNTMDLTAAQQSALAELKAMKVQIANNIREIRFGEFTLSRPNKYDAMFQ